MEGELLLQAYFIGRSSFVRFVYSDFWCRKADWKSQGLCLWRCNPEWL